MKVRTYRVAVRGFDFEAVFARASSRERARYLVARSYADAGHGSVRDGLGCITGCRLAPEESDRRLVVPELGPEGVCVSDAAHRSRAR